MALLHVVASRPLSGKSAIAVGIARGFASHGPVRLVRCGSGTAAEADAGTFAALAFASTPGVPVALESLTGFSESETVVIEHDSGVVPASGPLLLVIRGAMSEADRALVAGVGDRLLGTIATDIPPAAVEAVARDLTNAGLRPLALIPEDRALAAPSVGEIRDMLDAEVLFDSENDLNVVDDVVLAPVYADPASPHFRRFDRAAILAPFNKTDLHLAAIETSAACLVLTGGGRPSPYVVDRAQHGTTTVLLASGETPAMLDALSGVWLTSRFRGEGKADAVSAQLEKRIDIPGLLKKIS